MSDATGKLSSLRHELESLAMNLPYDKMKAMNSLDQSDLVPLEDELLSYKLGHRDARHAIAEALLMNQRLARADAAGESEER